MSWPAQTTALALMKDVMSEPVSLGAPVLDQLTSARGLRVGEAALVTAQSGAGKTELAYVIAARHLLRGGHIAWVQCPGSAGFCCRRIVSVLERLLCLHLIAAPSSTGAAAAGVAPPRFEDAVRISGGMDKYREQLLEIMSRLRSVACGTVGELASVFMGTYEGEGVAGAHLFQDAVKASGATAGRTNFAVRLLIVDGLGAACETSILERVVGQEAPIAFWLSEAVSRHRCALIVTDTLPGGNTHAAASPEALLEMSHTFRHLRGCQANPPSHTTATGFTAHPIRKSGSDASSRHLMKPPLLQSNNNITAKRTQTDLFRYALVLAAPEHCQQQCFRSVRTCSLVALRYVSAAPTSLHHHQNHHQQQYGSSVPSQIFCSSSFARQPYAKAPHYSRRVVAELKGFSSYTIGPEGLLFN